MNFAATQTTSTQDRGRRWAILASVAVLHAGVLYGLVVGLAGVVTLIQPPPRLAAHNDPLTVPVTPPAPPPTPKPRPIASSIHDRTNTPALQPAPTPLDLPSPDVGPIDDRMLQQALRDGDAPPLPAQPLRLPAHPAKPRGIPGAWISPEDYPAQDLREGNTGVTGFRLIIGRDGHPQSCTTIASSGHPRLDAVTCALVLRRAVFSPASDETGASIMGSYQTKVIWTIPQR